MGSVKCPENLGSSTFQESYANEYGQDKVDNTFSMAMDTYSVSDKKHKDHDSLKNRQRQAVGKIRNYRQKKTVGVDFVAKTQFERKKGR